MVLEGIHLVPGMLTLPAPREAIVAQCVFAIDDPAAHALHFYVRDTNSEGVRPVARYLDRIDEIRRIQDALAVRADREGVPVIESSNIDAAVTQVLDLVLAAVERLEPVA